MSALDNKAAYLKELARAAEFLSGNYLDEVQQLLPEKSLNRIKNARSGQVQDQEVLSVLKSIAERERVRRREKALQELRITKTPLIAA